ncbi:hypothetical protein jhhlp_001367 [Lomentospora prolificans]|uniref:60S ribosomal protein L21 n=1 Tax=Lomentospora prolificans TaxID=41688 RepID=A0A2N3NI34_9PEZI|nr:hypothetical protein jhhlp_001367 [Lomentospora prolificans]
MGNARGLRAGTRPEKWWKFWSGSDVMVGIAMLIWFRLSAVCLLQGFPKEGTDPPYHLPEAIQDSRVGDIVDIKANGAVQKGLPFKVYHGKTGVIYNVTKSAVGIIIYKKVKHRYLEKRLNVRIEHIQPSRSREGFLRRVKDNEKLRKQAKAEGKPVQLKRQPAMPREAHTLSLKEFPLQTVTPVPYETTI